MLTYNLENRDSTPLYEYIYKCIKNDILTGALKSGEKLPSKRSLADNLSVSLITIENAYSQLLYEGYIYSVEKKGYYISDIENYSIKQNENTVKTIASTTKSDSPAVDFQNNPYDKDIFPFSVWAKITRKTLLDHGTELLNKSENKGSAKLRLSIAEYLSSYKGMSVNPDNIVIGAGMEYLYGLILQLLGRNKMIAVEDPCHTKVSHIYESNGVKVMHIPIDNMGFNDREINLANVSCIHISPSHHYPTGIVMPAIRRHSIINKVRQNNVYIIEDDYDSELRYKGKPLEAMAALAPDKVIYMNTFSKTLMNSVRIAFMVLPDSLLDEYNKKLSFYSCTVSNMEQLTLSAFIDEGYFERHINRTRLFYKKCRINFINCFNQSDLSKHFSLIENDAGLHFLIKAKYDINDEAYLQKLTNKGIRINSIKSYCYRPDSRYEHTFIINYFRIDEEKLINIFNDMLP